MANRRLTDEEIANALARARNGEAEMPLLMCRTSLDDSMSDVVVGLLGEIQGLRASVLRHEKALDYLAFWKGDCDQHAIAWEIALGNMVLGGDYEAKPAPRESHALGEEG